MSYYADLGFEAITPEDRKRKKSASQQLGAKRNAIASQFTHSSTRTAKRLSKLAALESRHGDQDPIENRERSGSIDSQESQEDEASDIGEGDYGVDYYGSDGDDGLDDEGDDEAIM